MGRILHLIHAFLVAVFAVQTANLDAPQHAKRIAATKALHKCYPLSVPACAAVARSSESPEAVQRAEQVLARFAEVRTAVEWDARLWAMVVDPTGEFDGLPWFPWADYQHLNESQDVHAAMGRLVSRLRERGHFVGVTFYCEEVPDLRQRPCLPPYGAFCGVNNIRFAVRGLPWPFRDAARKPVPLWVVKRGWAMLKANNRGRPR